ncbi:MAG: DUF1540 domain-containing protein [Firmicutes bacterium]|jgi:hypothetical protein|nr:DUF1540 domain-containing protein [Bacillota bacterium]HPU00632.1 DUF1540 domain-containing protein [Bacillota bacterium]
MTEVRCTVKSCHYWDEGDYCTAETIWVKNNFAGDADDELFRGTAYEFAKEPGTEGKEGSRGEKNASTSSQTCCETMRPKKEGGEGRRGACR